jgi:D-lactate dehydrogenase (cytochrome)
MTLQCSVPMARMELLDEVQMKACNEYSGLSYPETPHLFLEFHGSETEVESQTQTVRDIAVDNDGGEFQWAVQQEDRTKLWTARHRAYYADIALRPGCRSLTTDVCVPVSALPDLVKATKADIAEHGLIGPMVGHVGDGNFHTMLLFDPADAEEFKKCKEVANKMARSAIALGGMSFKRSLQ